LEKFSIAQEKSDLHFGGDPDIFCFRIIQDSSPLGDNA